MSRLAKAIDGAAMSLVKAMEDPLLKAGHDAMHHHALHAAAAARAGKTEEAGQHRYMHMRHALENARCKGYHGMMDSMRNNMDHYHREGSDEVYAAAYGSSPVSGVDMSQPPKMHAAQKHFHKGGGFVPHAGDKAFKDESKGSKDAPKMGKK